MTHISKHGFWLLLEDRELFLPFSEFPWFKDAPVSAILNVERPHAHHLYWPDLDVDLSVESIEHPEKFPLISKAEVNNESRTDHASRSGGRNKLSLTIGREYEVLGLEANMYRILTDETASPWPNDPVLYDPDCFRVIDLSEPEFWHCTTGEDRERYCYPPEWSRVGFFEDYHAGLQQVRKAFWEGLKRYYPDTWRERCGHG